MRLQQGGTNQDFSTAERALQWRATALRGLAFSPKGQFTGSRIRLSQYASRVGRSLLQLRRKGGRCGRRKRRTWIGCASAELEYPTGALGGVPANFRGIRNGGI